MQEPKKLYFAYGSNMWKDQMRRRCPNSKFVGVGVYPGWKWIINLRGVATVVPSPGDNVYGLLYEVTSSDEETLDICECVPEKYIKEMVEIDMINGHKDIALIYIDVRSKEGAPKKEYVERINAAIEDAVGVGVPEDYVQKYIRKYIPKRLPKRQRSLRVRRRVRM